MILTKPELLASLQKEVRILTHLASKVDRAKLDYRPTPKQRSTLELLQYLSFSGPGLLKLATSTAPFDGAAWGALQQAAAARDFDQTVAAITAQGEAYASILASASDDVFRTEMTGFDGQPIGRGVFVVNLVLGGHAAYRMQLFNYLKACGREELGTMNVWRGADAPVAV